MNLIHKQRKSKMGSYPKKKYNKSHSKPSALDDEEISSDPRSSDSSPNSSDEIRFGKYAAGKG